MCSFMAPTFNWFHILRWAEGLLNSNWCKQCILAQTAWLDEFKFSFQRLFFTFLWKVWNSPQKWLILWINLFKKAADYSGAERAQVAWCFRRGNATDLIIIQRAPREPHGEEQGEPSLGVFKRRPEAEMGTSDLARRGLPRRASASGMAPERCHGKNEKQEMRGRDGVPGCHLLSCIFAHVVQRVGRREQKKLALC